MGIKLFLWISEVLSIKIEDFDHKLMMLESTSSYLSALASPNQRERQQLPLAKYVCR